MINVLRRFMRVPADDYIISDGHKLEFTISGIDEDVLHHAVFMLHLETASGDVVNVEIKRNDQANDMFFVYESNEMIKTPGSVLVFMTAHIDGVCVWQSYKGILFVEGETKKPADFRDKLKGLELAQVEEAERREKEKARADAEKSRMEAEQARAAAERARVEAEALRSAAESERVSTEASSVQAEQARVDAEKARDSAEKDRAAAEQARVDAENKRVAAEAARVEAEKERG
jgi:hypothetical protein